MVDDCTTDIEDTCNTEVKGGGARLFTVNVNVLVAVCDWLSVTVTVKVVTDTADVGVPLICPVDVLKDNPPGKLGDTE